MMLSFRLSSGFLLRGSALFVLALLLCSPVTVSAASPEAPAANKVEQSQATEVPLVRLKHWRDSTDQERYGFLVGFATALEMEKEWQGPKPLPLRLSLINNWTKGLSGITFKQMNDSINAYITANPDDLNRPVVEYLWFTFVQPKVTEKVDDAQVDRVRKELKKKTQ